MKNERYLLSEGKDRRHDATHFLNTAMLQSHKLQCNIVENMVGIYNSDYCNIL